MKALALAVLLAVPLAAQVVPPPADHYDVGIFRPAVSLVTPFSVTALTNNFVSCGHRKSDDTPDNVPNPTLLLWDDPSGVGTLECRVTIGPIVIGLPLGTGYQAALRTVAPDGTPSAWVFDPHTFRRAPRGLPCANGLPGVQFVGENDVDGKPVKLTICVQVTP